MIRFFLFLTVSASLLPTILRAAERKDPGKPDLVRMDSVSVSPGESFVLGLHVRADDVTSHDNKEWKGVGTFNIPLKYDDAAIRLDSVKFVGVFSKWDEKFTNLKIDTGFVAFSGIHNIAGGDNPVLHSPKKAEEVIRLFATVSKDAVPGVYLFETTYDPIQKDLFLGSIDGFHSWRPQFTPGKVVVK